jgi:murein L,D-transpeptidase YafK
MRLIIPNTSFRSCFAARVRVALATAVCAGLLAACGGGGITAIPPSEQPLGKDAMMLLGRKGMEQGAPIFVRIFKEESELEVWKARDDGRFYHFKTYPICNWSGVVGPKTEYGDRQAPEGFYRVSASQLNPNSQYYLAFNLGYPNAYDRALQRTGDALMVHGKCKSVGCYAMTDALMEEIYGLAREALKGGQEAIEVHAFPFRMTADNMARYQSNPNYPFWRTLKQGYDFFETYRIPPSVAVCERRYLVNVKFAPGSAIRPDATCPRFSRPAFTPFVPKPEEERLANERVTVPGPKTREIAAAPAPVPAATRSAGVEAAFGQPYALGAPADAIDSAIDSRAAGATGTTGAPPPNPQ